ncbi:MAG TPA: polyribonucleotide nucleotidyltransferase [bacterium]|nr:polyribonucleotide nucleotidyltransferase [bacterium]
MTEPTTHRIQLEVAGRQLTFETGWLARQAGGAVTVRYGDTMVLVTATGSEQPREGIDFFPLTCDFEEKMYAAGKIPGGFFKREGRPGENAIQSARLIDRPIRPLFPKGARNDVQVIATVLSADMENDPSILAINGASAALTISNVPFDGPIGAVRIGLVEGELVVNPLISDRDTKSSLDLVVAASEDAIIMIEAGANEVPEARILDALDLAHREIRKIIGVQRELASLAAKPKMAITVPAVDEELAGQIRAQAQPLIRQVLTQPEKLMREDALRQVTMSVAPAFVEQHPEREREIEDIIQGAIQDEVRRTILEDGRRPDGRGVRDIRPLRATVGLLPRAHGSGLFQRGQTQVLTVATLGTGEDEQIIDDLTLRERKRYMHHYNFPPFSVGEVRPLRSAGRREIGHGLLAERALERMVPEESVFPYTIRLVSEALESNGSTSMASVCGSTLALMDAGVPIKAPVAGISIGLITGGDGRVALLTDIQGIEDAMGDMDFKVAGTRAGVTALQLDIKIKGLRREVLAQAMAQARDARMTILDVMAQAIPEPRANLSPYAPRIITIEINPEKIREVIGPGGKVINKITAETGVKIDIEQDGRVNVASADEDAARRAIKMIEDIVREVKVGEIYTGRVTRLMNFGAFVELLPGKEGLLHVSELGDGERVERVEDAVKVGDEVTVRVREIDNLGRVNLTKRLTPGPQDETAREAARGRGRQGPRGTSRGRDDGRHRRREPRPDSRGPRP